MEGKSGYPVFNYAAIALLQKGSEGKKDPKCTIQIFFGRRIFRADRVPWSVAAFPAHYKNQRLTFFACYSTPRSYATLRSSYEV